MNKGLDLIKRRQPEIIDGYPTGNVYIGLTQEELIELENELKEHEQHKAIEEKWGIDLILFSKIMETQTLWWKDRRSGYIHNIASEFISIKPYISIGGFMMFEFSWNDRNLYNYENCDVIINKTESPMGLPHIYLCLKASDYGTLWALTKEELK